MEFKKFLSLALVACFVFSLTACGGGQKPTSDVSKDDTSSSAVQTDSNGETIATDTESDNESNASTSGGNSTGSTTKVTGGKTTASTASSGNNASKIAAAKAKLNFNKQKVTIMREWDAYPRGKATVWDNWNDRVAEVEKKFNVDIVEKKWTVTLAQEVLSGVKPEGNLYQVGSGAVYDYVSKGYLADYNDAMSKTGIDMKSSVYNKMNVQLNNVNSKQYTAGYEEARTTAAIVFNKKIVEGLGYNIYDLMTKKQWTWSKMTEIAKKATKRNAAGEVTQYGLGLNTSAVSALSVSNGGKVGGFDSTGKPTINLSSQPVRQAMQQVYDWCNIDKVATYNWGNLVWYALDDEFAKGKIAMYFGGHSAIGKAYASLTDEWGVAYLPIGPKSTNYVSYLQDEYSYVVPLAYKDQADKYLLLLDELYQPYKGYTRDDQFRDEWIRRFKDAQSYNTFKSLHRTVTPVWDPVNKLKVGTDTTTYASVIGKLFAGTITVGTLVDTYQNAFTTNLKDDYKNIKYTGTV